MKRVLILFSFLLASATIPLLGSADAAPKPALDADGKNVLAGIQYYILPVIRGRGGGLTLASTSKNKSCPLDVVQERREVSKGLPVTFTPVNQKKGVVRESTDLNIKFAAATMCAQSTVWKLSNYNPLKRQWFVTTGGVEGNPGRETTGNWFKIEKYGPRDYKLVFCPTVCRFCKVLCKDIGIYIDEHGNRRLALSEDPFKVKFKKVSGH